MKPIQIVLIFVVAFVFTLAFLSYRAKRRKPVSNGTKPTDAQNILATNTTTTIVDPTTSEEYIISGIGENNLDNTVGSSNMRAAISAVVNDIDNRTGEAPATFTIKTYGPSGNLIGQTTIGNPYQKNIPKGTTAFESMIASGATDYSCNEGLSLAGPGYYRNDSNAQLFGMFCN